jgi:hypothetical protein
VTIERPERDSASNITISMPIMRFSKTQAVREKKPFSIYEERGKKLQLHFLAIEAIDR